MRRVVGLLILLYGLVLALNTVTLTMAEFAGDKVAAGPIAGSQECAAPLGSPPFGGVYGYCVAQWSGSDSGRLFGPRVADRLQAGPTVAYRCPLFDGYAVLPPSNFDQVAAIISVLIIVLGVLLLAAERQRRAQQSTEDDDSLALPAPRPPSPAV